MQLHSLENNPEYIRLQTEMVWLQRDIMESGKRLAILFEGRDTAGKSGAIMRFVRFINPAATESWLLTSPTNIERAHGISNLPPRTPQSRRNCIF